MDWLAESPGDEQIRYPLLLTVGFGRHLDPQVLRHFMTEHRARHAARLTEYEGVITKDYIDPYTRATVEFGIRYERAVLEWFDAVSQSLP
ncbi:MAG: hypothetical protein ACRDZ2_08670 [Ilumatobacteraceae bacterium]